MVTAVTAATEAVVTAADAMCAAAVADTPSEEGTAAVATEADPTRKVPARAAAKAQVDRGKLTCR